MLDMKPSLQSPGVAWTANGADQRTKGSTAAGTVAWKGFPHRIMKKNKKIDNLFPSSGQKC